MNYNAIREKLEKLINELSENGILNLENLKSEKYLSIVNKYNFLIMLGDIESYRPVCLNNYAIDFLGFENNWMKEEDYIHYMKIFHTDTYASFLEIFQFYKKDVQEYLDIDYKLLYKNTEWKIVKGVTKVLVRKDNLPKYSITLAYYDNSADFSYVNKLGVLTQREIELTDLLCSGFSKKEVAEKLNISLATVKTHTKNIYKKLDITKISELVALNEKYSTT